MSDTEEPNPRNEVQDTVSPIEEIHDEGHEQQGYTWEPSEEMLRFPTRIHKDNTLSQEERKLILQAQPRNKNIRFQPPSMDKTLWKNMSKQTRETDKLLSKLAYRWSATLRPLDNTLRLLYDSKPDQDDKEALESWEAMEQSLMDTRSLLLDGLSYANDIRRDQAIKCISPSYNPPAEHEEVCGPTKLNELITQENEKNKLFNKALQYKRQFRSSESSSSHGRGQYNPRFGTRRPVPTSLYLQSFLKTQHNLQHWVTLFKDSWATKVINNGYSIQWNLPPPLTIQSMSHHTFNLEISSKIEEFLKLGAIKQISSTIP
ncbi:16939_t:CDS:2, partial [Dentiscutata heterogama]